MITLGIQVSIAGHISNSVERAAELGCTAMQIFARNPRQYRKSTLSKEDVALFRQKLKATAISSVVIHTPYTINLGASKRFLYQASIKEFIDDIKEARRLGAHYIVIHTGTFNGRAKKGLEKIVRALQTVLQNTAGINIGILLENTAGDGSSLGYEFSHHGYIFKQLRNNKRLGLCLDTAHAWCAGYAINTQEGLDTMLKEIDREVGINRLKVIHLNDTLNERGSHKDRHYHIGKGAIGAAGFKLIVNHPLLRALPFILETPKADEGDDASNLAFVRKIYKDGVYKKK